MTTPPRDDDAPGRYGSTTDAPGRYGSAPDMDDTRTNLRAMRASLTELRAMRAEDRAMRARLIKWAVGTIGSVLAIGLIPTMKMLISVGEISEQQRAARADVAEVLTVTSTLVRDGEVTRTKLDESAHDRAALHESLRSLEAKVWEVTRRQREGAP